MLEIGDLGRRDEHEGIPRTLCFERGVLWELDRSQIEPLSFERQAKVAT